MTNGMKQDDEGPVPDPDWAKPKPYPHETIVGGGFNFEPPPGKIVHDAELPPIREGKWAGLGTHFEVGVPNNPLEKHVNMDDDLSSYLDDGITDADLAKTMREGLGIGEHTMPPILSTDSKERKQTPMYSGFLAYFPEAVAAVAQLSFDSNEKHNPGEPLHWSHEKSSDHKDCIMRHLVENGTYDPDDNYLHDVKLAWRAMANLTIVLRSGKKAKL